MTAREFCAFGLGVNLGCIMIAVTFDGLVYWPAMGWWAAGVAATGSVLVLTAR